MLRGKVLITGGAGYIARAIYRRARREDWPVEFTCLSRDDAKHAALQQRFPEVRTIAQDIRGDLDVLTSAFRGHDLVIHAAASKYVDRAERAARDTMTVNIHGSDQVARAAIRAAVPMVVGISTDKACLPVNVYGMSKAVMERLLQESDALSDTQFKVCRYGNVVGSTGSVVPIFRRQLETQGYITATDPRMTRFWMSHEEAIDTILHTVHEGTRGSVVVPSPRAMSLHNLILTALGAEEPEGFLPEGQVRIIGIRPGEKLHESLIHYQESPRVVDGGPFSDFYEVRPPGWAPADEDAIKAFEVSSGDPPSGWIAPGEMRSMMDAAAEV